MEFSIIAHNFDKAERHMYESGERARDFGMVFEEVAADIFRIEEAIFKSSGRRGGGSWKGDKLDTLQRKGFPKKILVDSGSLKSSVTEPGANYQILHVNKLGIEFGTSRPYAAVHQFGHPYNNRPKRPFIRFLPTDISRWSRWMIERVMLPFNT